MMRLKDEKYRRAYFLAQLNESKLTSSSHIKTLAGSDTSLYSSACCARNGEMPWKCSGSATGMGGGVSQEEMAVLKRADTTAVHAIDSEVCSRVMNGFQNRLTALLVKEDGHFERFYQ
ncbi:hypothetical protein AVEN_16982-1 [Araneus ventricosus]|uniref:Uncharacterized protein n=1 Tax=Araneus ventricosus TaxID=182803 RepID=A0A4Y2WMG7_ARAVE|nr:hypothetical protein AVEN_16982-1 [Araneus ventricosus]